MYCLIFRIYYLIEQKKEYIMPGSIMTHLGNLRRFSHELDSMTPFMIYEGVYDNDLYLHKTVGDVHFDPQIFMILSGDTDFFLDDVRFSGCDGDIFLSNFWEPHAYRMRKCPLHYLVITFSMFALGENTPFKDFDWHLFMLQSASSRKIKLDEKEKKEMLLLAGKILELHKNTPPGFRSMQWLLIQEILFHINSKFLSGKTAKNLQKKRNSIFPALELIRHSPNREIPLDEAAEACSMSRSTFCLEFKRIMNESFSRFAMKKRIGYSCMLLHLNKFTIKEISDQCGFKNIPHFYHVFRKFCQCTPKEFISRKNIAEKQEQ